jgi:hypothetical protein
MSANNQRTCTSGRTGRVRGRAAAVGGTRMRVAADAVVSAYINDLAVPPAAAVPAPARTGDRLGPRRLSRGHGRFATATARRELYAELHP